MMPGFPTRRSCDLPLLLCVLLVLPAASRAQTPAPTPAPLTLALPTPTPAANAVLFPETADGGPRYVPPKVLQRAPVGYPELAHLNRAEGVVLVRFSIDEAGNVIKAWVDQSSGSLMLDSFVRDPSLLRWKFQPATLDGKPVPSSKQQEFEFRLDPAEEKAIALRRLTAPIGKPDAPYPAEAFALKPRGAATITVRWTKGGLVDQIYLDKGTGSNVLDRVAVRWAYEHWRVDPATINDKNKDEVFTKTMTFEPPK